MATDASDTAPWLFSFVGVMPVMTGGRHLLRDSGRGQKRNATTLRAGRVLVASIWCGIKKLRLTRR
jgi:hypothetical protein